MLQRQITDIKSLIVALQKRVDFFDTLGCKLSDFGVSGPLIFNDFTEEDANTAFKERLSGKEMSKEQKSDYCSYVLYELAKMYHAKGWAQQFHLGVIRNNNDRLSELLG